MTNDLEIIKKKMVKENIKIETEKDMIKRKISNFKNTIENGSNSHDVHVAKSKRMSSLHISDKSEIAKKEVNFVFLMKKESSDNSSKTREDNLQIECENISTKSNYINVGASKKYLLESEDDGECNLASLDNNFLNDINSEVENNIDKYNHS